MNLWTGIALANLQRVRPNPRELEDKHVCTKCGTEKAESDFRFNDEGEYFLRDKICRVCRHAEDAERRKKRAGSGLKRRLVAAEVRGFVLQHLAASTATISQLDAAICASRRTLERTVKALREEGLVAQVGRKKLGTNDKIPVYGLTHGASGAGKELTA